MAGVDHESAVGEPEASNGRKGQRFEWEREFLRAAQTKTQVAVGLVLATYFGPKLRAYPSQKRIADKAHCNVSTVRKTLDQLEEMDFLRIERRGPGAGAGHTNRYQGLIPATENGAEGTRFSPSQTVPRRPVPESQNGSLETQKRVPRDIETGPPGTPNSKEQHRNSAARKGQQSIDEMKREHPDLWTAALDDVDRRSAAGVDIRNREAYAATILPDLVEKRRGERQLEAKSIEDATAIVDCKRCGEDGWYWEDQELPYKPKRTKCRHQPTRSDPAATDGNVPALAVQSPMRTNAGAESRTERLNLGSDGGVTYESAR